MIRGFEWWQAPTSGIWHVVGIGPQPRKEIADGDQLVCGWVRRRAPVPPEDLSGSNRGRDGACCRTCAQAILAGKVKPAKTKRRKKAA